MNRHLKTILFFICLTLTKPIYSQSNSDNLIFIKIGIVYESNLIDFWGELYMLKFKDSSNSYAASDKVFFELSKGEHRSSMEISESTLIYDLSKIFDIYKVQFDNSQSGHIAESILKKANCYDGFLIPLQKDYGVVTHYIIQRLTKEFDFVKYRVTNFECNDTHQCCVVKIESLR